MTNSLLIELNTDCTSLEERLQTILTSIKNPLLRESVAYALFSGGKRLRPKMLLSITGAKGIDVAAAIECIHTYTLIHDDLPSMDNDDIRRGKPTLHKAFDEATAILTGDLLLTLAFEILANAPLSSSLTLIRIFSKYIGANGIIDGQVQDLKKPVTSWEEYQEIAIKKTADLFTATLIAASVIVEERDLSLFTQFGKTYGILYQIYDDLEDQNAPLSLTTLGPMAHLLQIHARHLLQSLSIKNPFLESLLFSLQDRFEPYLQPPSKELS